MNVKYPHVRVRGSNECLRAHDGARTMVSPIRRRHKLEGARTRRNRRKLALELLHLFFVAGTGMYAF